MASAWKGNNRAAASNVLDLNLDLCTAGVLHWKHSVMAFAKQDLSGHQDEQLLQTKVAATLFLCTCQLMKHVCNSREDLPNHEGHEVLLDARHQEFRGLTPGVCRDG